VAVVGTPEDVRRWAARWPVVEARIREQPAPSQKTAIEMGFRLVDHLARTQGWPVPENALRLREIARARAHWRRLLDRWPAR